MYVLLLNVEFSCITNILKHKNNSDNINNAEDGKAQKVLLLFVC